MYSILADRNEQKHFLEDFLLGNVFHFMQNRGFKMPIDKWFPESIHVKLSQTPYGGGKTVVVVTPIGAYTATVGGSNAAR